MVAMDIEDGGDGDFMGDMAYLDEDPRESFGDALPPDDLDGNDFHVRALEALCGVLPWETVICELRGVSSAQDLKSLPIWA